MTSRPTRTPWNSADYSPAVTGSGAIKLADSGVAPLVAMARGYSSMGDKDGARSIAQRSSDTTGTSIIRRLNQMVVEDEDALVIPWFRATDVTERGPDAKSRTLQMRPSRPLRNKSGKTAKYEFLSGEGTTLDLNPATPGEWINGSFTILMTEGAIKGDSALTGQLRAAGITDEQLSQVPPSAAQARAILSTLMTAVPQDQRVTILSFAGVANWRDQPDWRSIKLQDRRALVAFDGDTTTNWQVWRQARALFEFIEYKHGTPYLLNLGSPEAELAKIPVPGMADAKLGIDDYLTRVGDWAEVLSYAQPDLPQQPERPDEVLYAIGDMRVRPTDPTIVEEFTQETAGDGTKMPPSWVRRVGIGGRLRSMESRRRPHPSEIDSGVIDHTFDAELGDSTCTIDLSWKDANGATQTGVVSGPANLLAHNVADWPRHGAIMPNPLLALPEWPPKKGMEWLSAIKAHHAEDVAQLNSWAVMGWVPGEHGNAAFIVGNQVLARTRDEEANTIPGVTDKVLGGASSFGVIDRYHELNDVEAWKSEICKDMRTVLETYIESGAWKERSAAVTAVAGMYRPTLPVRPSVTIYIYGPPRAGKTFTAVHMMGAWQSSVGTWTIGNLPGAAGDTAAAMEYSIARSPIWVADDLAPTVDKRQAEQQEAAVGNIIRAVHNGSGRRKMDGRTNTQREQSMPTALLVMTAENEPQVASIRERIVAISTPKDMFSNGDAVAKVDALNATDGAPARLTAALIRFWLNDEDNIYGTAWPERLRALKDSVRSLAAFGQTVLLEEHGMSAGEAARHAAIAADLAITFEVLRELALWAGFDPEDPLIDKLGRGPGSYMQELFAQAAKTIERQRESTPGAMLVQTLTKLMASGRAHIGNTHAVGQPPYPVNPDDGDDAAAIAASVNSALGWTKDSQDAWVPKGLKIGHFGMTASGRIAVVVFEHTTAFNEAQKFYPGRILHGANPTVAWSSVWSEGLCAEYARTEQISTVRVGLTNPNSGRAQYLRGVPVLLSALLEEQPAAAEAGTVA